MTAASIINLLTTLLCTAVLVQCWRMTRALDRFRAADFPAIVTALKGATDEAEGVLNRIRSTLATDAEPKLRALADANRIADELGVMIGIANASADRLLDVARQARPAQDDLAA